MYTASVDDACEDISSYFMIRLDKARNTKRSPLGGADIDIDVLYFKLVKEMNTCSTALMESRLREVTRTTFN